MGYANISRKSENHESDETVLFNFEGTTQYGLKPIKYGGVAQLGFKCVSI